MDARSPDALDVLVDCLPEVAQLVADLAPLVSLEDHTPGQGQFRKVQQRIEVRDGLLANVERNRSRLGQLAREGRIRLLMHDMESRAELEVALAYGAAVAEFPTTVEAARAAHEAGMPVVMGAPNIIRGGSHSGNVSAHEVVGAGLVDALASDYAPPTLLAAALQLALDDVLPLPAAVALITSGPARTAGLTDRGSLVVGQRADLLLVDTRDRWPHVRMVLPLPYAAHVTEHAG